MRALETILAGKSLAEFGVPAGMSSVEPSAAKSNVAKPNADHQWYPGVGGECRSLSSRCSVS